MAGKTTKTTKSTASTKKSGTGKSAASKSGAGKSGTAKTAPKKAKASEQAEPASTWTRIGSDILGVVLIAVGVLLAVYVYSEQASTLGSFFHTGLLTAFGFFAYVIPPALFVLGILSIAGSKHEPIAGSKAVIIISLVLLIALTHIVSGYMDITDADGNNMRIADFIRVVDKAAMGELESCGRGGGVVGGLICYCLYIIGGDVLCYIVLISGLLVCVLLLTRISIKTFAGSIKEQVRKAAEKEQEIEDEFPDDFDEDDLKPQKRVSDDDFEPDKRKLFTVINLDEDDKPKKQRYIPFDEAFTVPDPDPTPTKVVAPRSGYAAKGRSAFTPITIEDTAPKAAITPLDDAPPFDPDPPAPKPRRAKAVALTEPLIPAPLTESKAAPETEPTPENAEEYVPPAIDYLSKPNPYDAKAVETPDEVGQHLVQILANFGVEITIQNIVVGPTVTRFEVQPGQGVRVNRITSLSNDIALGLAAKRVNFEAPIPGKSAVGIEVPNKTTATVLLRDIVESPEFMRSKSALPMAIGKNIGGRIIVADLSRMPHMLIAGATGSGKSVCINNIIISLIYKLGPKDLKLILVDPKKVEMTAYGSLPHLLTPVVTDPKKAAGALRWACTEMDQRYKLFAARGARDLARYNELIGDEKRLYKLVVIIDELSDLMMVASDDVQDSICRIAQLGRAAGIHLIVATQRPSVDVITGVIKANIPSRCAFAVSSATDSRIILDQSGAEKLLGRGDMLFHPSGASVPERLQCAFVSDDDIEKVTNYFAAQNIQQDFAAGVTDAAAGGAVGGVFGEGKQEDELLSEAVRIVIDSGIASISLIQRKLRVGYARAARLVDIMEQHGYVSGFDGSKPRKVLITRAKYAEVFGVDEYNPPEDEA